MTNATSESTLFVGLYLPGDEAPTIAALMKLQRAGLLEGGHLAYGLGYLGNPRAEALGPQLPLQRDSHVLGRRLLRDGGAMPLIVRDALPDAWGRLVIARELGGRLPGDRELLLLTNEDRIGAMVFSETQAMPPAPGLPHDELAQVADAVNRLQYDLDIPERLKHLLLRGGSLGGARPKASFAHDQALWLAKFPAIGDPVDVQTLEALAMGLAAACGIRVPAFFTLPLGHGDKVFLSCRFDRSGPQARQRIHYLSASALLDIPYESSAGSYIALARVLRRLSIAPGVDLEELFRRLIFNLLIDNSDDHLKNHGMLYAGNGLYRLSPAFDVVPQLSNLGYQMLSIDGSSHASSLELAIQAAPHFDLSPEQARAIVQTMADTVEAGWRTQAAVVGASSGLCRHLESCLLRQAELIGLRRI